MPIKKWTSIQLDPRYNFSLTNRFDLSLLSQRKATIPSPFTRKHITKERKGGRAIVRFAHFLSPVIFRILLERKEFEAGVGRFPPFFANVPPNASLKKKELVFLSISFIDTRTYPARGKGRARTIQLRVNRTGRSWMNRRWDLDSSPFNTINLDISTMYNFSYDSFEEGKKVDDRWFVPQLHLQLLETIRRLWQLSLSNESHLGSSMISYCFFRRVDPFR